ncbi:MAG: MBL fold metallo-hydrolase [Erysipelotrichaceae bacterium]
MIEVKQLNTVDCKTYMVRLEGKDAVVLIDPLLDEVARYTSMLEEQSLNLVAVIDTHTHADHLSGSALLSTQCGCAYYMHQLAPAPCVTHRMEDATSYYIAGIEFYVHHAKGHTQDSMALEVTGYLFTGDALFLDDGGAGRDDLPGGSASDHYATLSNLKQLNETLMVLPAHDYRNRKSSTLAQQKQTNPFLQFTNQQEFETFIEDLKLGPAEWMKPVLVANAKCAMRSDGIFIPKDTPACEVKGTLTSKYNIPTIEPAQLHLYPNATWLDVREAEELFSSLGHLEGIIHIPVGQLIEKQNKLPVDKSETIVVICKSGGRATTGAQLIRDMGYEHVYVMRGGMLAYREQYEKKDQ